MIYNAFNLSVLSITVLALFLIAYHHAIYPMLLKLYASRQKKSLRSVEPTIDGGDDKLPSISVIIPAYNEERFIVDKLKNLASLDYPSSKLELVVACDGCTDNTVSLIKQTLLEPEFDKLNFFVHDFKHNRGKCAVINDLMRRCNSDITALSDVSSIISIDALKLAAQCFNDERVGAVNGNYRFLNPQTAGEQHYWKFQRNIKLGEQQLGSLLGAHGALYFIRTELFEKLPENTVNDDFIIPSRVIKHGKRIAYVEQINAVELEDNSQQANWKRRIRIGFGNAQQICILRNLFHPKHAGIALAFFSGKGLRVFMPFLMIIALFGSLTLAFKSILFLLIFCAQISFYTIALLASVFNSLNKNKYIQTIFYIVSGHAANMIGCIQFFSQTKAKW
ncbi:glycosyltransferase family 2 protein [Agaribacterium haliotis]|uniref:glycosyltransferase family 2 protein n=1 Tax=Agaribacterium haliotis TaxID=2013869 RepID=UPI000BB55F74|nr:glycosyltransferase family 2 protein [Agaribacterium haliotis]